MGLAAACTPTTTLAPTGAPEPGVAAASAVVADTSHAPRIARIEASLLPGMRVRGRTYEPARLEARMRELGVPGLSVAVIEDGRIVWARAYGMADAMTRAPATTETLFQAASMSKPVAAMGVLALVQEGRLDLSDDVNRWLTRWRVPAHEWSTESPVTLSRILSHTAGLTVHGFPGYADGAAVPEVEQILAGAPPANTAPVVISTRPGEVYRYSGGGTTVVQLLVEEVTGVPFARFMSDRVLAPIGMTSSTFEQPLPFTGDDRFLPVAGGSVAVFERAAVGAISALRIGGLRLPRERNSNPPPDPVAHQRAFFENLRAMCGQTFGGRTILAPVTDETFEPARLFMIVEECEGDEIRVPFIVGDDDSRTWVFQMGDAGLTFFHEHIRPDGTPYDVSGFGGHASTDGTATFQSFPDFWTTDDTPAEEYRVWRLRIDRDHDLFVYYLDRGGVPAYRLVFHMGAPSPPLRR